jgi:hypothetical protein
MKPIVVFVSLFTSMSPLWCQSSFIYAPITERDNTIYDAWTRNDTTFALESTIDSTASSSILLLSDQGQLIEKINVAMNGFTAMRFVSLDKDEVNILGVIKNDTCENLVSMVALNFRMKTCKIISTFKLCNRNIAFLRLSKNISNDYFILVGTTGPGKTKFLLETDSAFNMNQVQDSLAGYLWISNDFSREGYVLKNEDVCYFFDANFNFMDAKVNPIIGSFVHEQYQTHRPFLSSYIIEEFSGSLDFWAGSVGHYIRVIDENLNVVRSLLIPPQHPLTLYEVEPPLMGGLDFTNETSTWIAGNNEITTDYSKVTHVSLSKVNEELELMCNEFIGFDAFYKLIGIRATPDGGVVAYGMKYTDTKDPYLIKLGPNCELPTTSTIDSDLPLISISAYPNPGINEISFSVQGFDPSALRVEFIDVPGQVVFAAKDLSNRMEVADLPAGQYFYRILQGDRLLGVGAWVKQ